MFMSRHWLRGRLRQGARGQMSHRRRRDVLHGWMIIRPTMFRSWTPRLITFLLWALAAWSGVFWALKSLDLANASSKADALAKSASLAMTTASNNPLQDVSLQVAKTLGAQGAVTEPTAASKLAAMQARFQLLGVLAVGTAHGAALLSIDSKPAKPYRVGSPIEDGLEVTSVGARSASIGTNGATSFTLELPLKK